jgi:hypothetical protein
MSDALRDLVLLDLIERVGHMRGALDATLLFDDVPGDLRDTIDGAVTVLGAAFDYLDELREQRHASARR